MVGRLRRGEKLRLPKGPDRVEVGDRVLVITTKDLAGKVSEYLA